ncbi:arsenate reductase family protein [Taibaiella soli]|uniref:arsenate reductase family protein n=1 Tax=Taibaiella soli TaxID=1649169 RepID=UPI001FB2C606|nr:ArsC/Spx/MgsR family protein [Taibaiella soli]
MINKIYFLSTCDTCRKIMKEIGATEHGFELQDIKKEPITEQELDAMKEKAGSYEALFSRKSQQYKALGLAEKTLTEADYKKYILEHYTFLKRPVVAYQGKLFIGNDKRVIEDLIIELMPNH